MVVLGQQLLNVLNDLITCLSTAHFIAPAGAPLPLVDYSGFVPIAESGGLTKDGNNRKSLKSIQGQLNSILSSYHFIEKNGQRIALVGVENWGSGRFKKAGDLNKALKGVAPEDFKILMSHDPSHWEAEVLPHPYNIHLTLSGHTHGMQFGIEIPGWIKWSPVQWRYKQWAGIYGQPEQRINVNRGFGYLAYPGRVGMWPEVTSITLKKAKTVV